MAKERSRPPTRSFLRLFPRSALRDQATHCTRPPLNGWKCHGVSLQLQRWAKAWSPGLVNFVPAVSLLFCMALPGPCYAMFCKPFCVPLEKQGLWFVHCHGEGNEAMKQWEQ